MLVLQYPFFRLGEAWFGEKPRQERVDLISYRQYPEPLPHASCHPRLTLLTDLRREPDDILAAMSRETRYEIRRAQRDKLQHQFWCADAAASIPEFCRFYNRFARQKRLLRANPRRLHAMAKAGTLVLSVVSHDSLGPLVWHAIFLAAGRARGLYSASHYRSVVDSSVRNLMGRANRYHHWCDMLELCKRGASFYDWGGWYGGTTDAEKLRVNCFKKGFGGTIVQEYDGWAACSPVGHVVLAAARLAGRLS